MGDTNSGATTEDYAALRKRLLLPLQAAPGGRSAPGTSRVYEFLDDAGWDVDLQNLGRRYHQPQVMGVDHEGHPEQRLVGGDDGATSMLPTMTVSTSQSGVFGSSCTPGVSMGSTMAMCFSSISAHSFWKMSLVARR